MFGFQIHVDVCSRVFKLFFFLIKEMDIIRQTTLKFKFYVVEAPNFCGASPSSLSNVLQILFKF